MTVDPRNESIIYVSDVECSDDNGMSVPRGRCAPARGARLMTASFTGIRRLETHPALKSFMHHPVYSNIFYLKVW